MTILSTFVQCPDQEDGRGLGNAHRWLETFHNVAFHIIFQAPSLRLIIGLRALQNSNVIAYVWAFIHPFSVFLCVCISPPVPTAFQPFNSWDVVWRLYHKRVLHALQKQHMHTGKACRAQLCYFFAFLLCFFIVIALALATFNATKWFQVYAAISLFSFMQMLATQEVLQLISST